MPRPTPVPSRRSPVERSVQPDPAVEDLFSSGLAGNPSSATLASLPYRHTAPRTPFKTPELAQNPFEPVSPAHSFAPSSPALSTSRFLDSPQPSDSTWSPAGSPRYSPPTSLLRSPVTTNSSAMPARPPHLSQRSVPHQIPVLGSDDGSPFSDTPYNAAASREGTSSNGHFGMPAGTAIDMRSDRAEWIPTQHSLYNESTLSHDDASRALMSRAASDSGHSHSGTSSSRKYDLGTLSPEVLFAFEKTRYSKEADDALHEPGPTAAREGRERRILETKQFRGSTSICTLRGWANLGAIILLLGSLIMLFAGYPIVDYFTRNTLSNFGAVGLGGTNASGQVADIPGFRGLIDRDTPSSVMARTGFDGKAYQLVFSDEFNQDGRTFYPGDDPFWEAADLHYWQTNNLEWYDPGQIETEGGYLKIQLTKESKADSHGLGYLGGLLQSWNKFCFTGGYLEVAVSLPGDDIVQGLWPAAWTMGNLGRAGYGGSLDGNWPYTYDSCDIGTLPNQTLNGLPRFPAALGDKYNQGALSYLPGQRLSACTCPGENHPGPVLSDGSLRGRAASEIDIFEATVDTKLGGQVSQSAQWGPFNPGYVYDNKTAGTFEIFDSPFQTEPNNYIGGVYQQVTSALSLTNPRSYNSTTVFESYGFEYTPTHLNGEGTGKITWAQNNQAMWTLHDSAMAANRAANISNRAVTGEPLYIMLNLGMSENFGFVDLARLTFPAVMRVDYVRVYQPVDRVNIGCSPPDFPTADYIAKNIEAYSNPNITVLADMGQTFPKNRLTSTC